MPSASIVTAEHARDATAYRALAWAYGLAHGGKTLFWVASDLYFTFYMTEVCGVSPLRTGLVIGCSLLFAAVADLAVVHRLAGSIGTAIHPGRAQAVGAVVSAAALIGFAGVAFVPADFRLAGSILALFTFRAAYALFDVPQNALLALAVDTDRRRAQLAAIRNMTGGVARTSLAFAFVPLMTGHGATTIGFRFLLLVLLLSALVVGGALNLARIAVWRSAPSEPSAPDEAATHGAIHLMAMMFGATIVTTAFSQIEPYLASYGIADRLSAGGFMGLVAIGSAVSQPFWLARIAGRQEVALLRQALAIMALGAACLVVLPRETLLGSGTAGFLYGVGAGGVMFALWTGIARAASGRAAFVRIGRFTACAKLAQGVAVISAGALMGNSTSRLDGDALALTMGAIVVIGVLTIAGASLIGREHRFRF